MKSGRSNKFSRAIGHLKSTTIDEKLQLQLLSEIPTNNTYGVYTDEPERTVTTTLNPNLNPLDLTQDDPAQNGRDTSGLFMPDGTILTEEPPGDTSYILGPMAAMYYTWSYPWTMIGYIRQSDRRMVNLGRIDGKLSDWDGSAGSAGSGTGTFSSYGQLTVEQARWFRDVQKQPGATNHPNTYNYYAFYPGPPSQTPDANGRYPCVITGKSKNRTETNIQKPTQKPINPEWGLSGYMFIKNEKTGKWEKKYYYNDGTVSSERSGEMTPDNPFYDAYQRGGGDQAAENGYSRDEIIRNGNEQIQREADQQARQDYQDTLRNMSDKPLTIDDFKRAADYSAYKNGGGDAARLQGKSVEEIINQGIQNINQYNQDPRISQGMADALDVKNSNSLGDKIMRFFGDLGDLAQGKVINSTDYNAQLAINLTKSVITGSPQEITLGDGAKRDQINSVDSNALGNVLQIGTAPTPNASNAVNPTPGMKSDQVLQGGWGAQGGSEFSYDPVTDTFTITSNKMLRTGQDGDQFDITKGGRTSDGQVVDPGKQTAFGDIPDVDPKVVDQKAKEILDSPVIKGYLNTLGTVVGATQGTGNLYQTLKNNPDAYEKFENDVAQIGRDIARGGVQGSASNAVAIRKALTDLGFPKSETENMGAGYGQVFSQTEYKGSEIPKEIRGVINQKTRQNESFGGYTRKRILREIKKETILPDEKKEKLKGYRPKTYGSLHTQYDKLMQKAENPASFKQMDETAWTKHDKYYNERLSQERKNEVLDHLGTGDHYWDLICETGKNSREKGLQEKYGDYTLVRKEQLAGDTLLFLVDENGKKESILQSEYSDRIARQIEEPLWEQETLNAPNDPLIKRIKNKLATQIDYPDKPSPMGYPDGATPQQVAGWHPEYGKRAAYYNALDPQSADAMPLTGDPETDVKVDAQKTTVLKRVSAIRKKKGKPNS